MRARRLTFVGAVAVLAVAAVTVALIRHTHVARATVSTTTIGTIELSPEAVTLPNSARVGGSGTKVPRIKVSLAVLGVGGRPITSGRFATPITLRIYGPASPVLSAVTPVVRSPAQTIYFKYTGGFVANSIIVTAVSGHAFALMSFQPKHHAFPGTSSVTLPMPNGTRNIKRGWGFSASVGGGPSHTVEMDTGSRGLVVPASILGHGAVGPGPAGQIEYTSDGKEFLGNYYLAPIKLSAGGATATTVPIRILAVNKSACAPGYPKCKAGGINGLGVMGVGFARGKASSVPPELTNAFLALRNTIQGSMHPGYIIRRSGVTVGITAANESGFRELSLSPGGSGPGDWNTAPGCFSFPKISGYSPQCGTVLVDTGIASAILGLPKSRRPSSISSSIPSGVQIHIDVAKSSGASPILGYGFRTGAGGPIAPTSIRWAAGSAPFTNTGRRPISRFDYLFDAGSGKLGFKPV